MSRQTFDDIFFSVLGELLDAEAQLAVGSSVIRRAKLGPDLEAVVADIGRCSSGQVMRLEIAFRLLGRSVRTEPCWSTAPLLVDALDAAKARDETARHAGVGLALLSILHLQIIRLQSLSAWAVRC